MHRTSNLVLPYDPAYRGHWEEERRRSETRRWLERQTRRIRATRDAPSVVPEIEDRRKPPKTH